jgi:uncharacterized membrane protein YphA (DoxX/SURF4 family)
MRGRWLQISLWVAQVLLAVAFGSAGFLKTVTPIADLTTMMGWPGDFPAWFTRFLGIAELAGAVAMILPPALRILPWLTPLAAAGFAIVQVAAIVLHATRGETAMTLPANAVLLALSLFVLWGRWKRLPVSSR